MGPRDTRPSQAPSPSWTGMLRRRECSGPLARPFEHGALLAGMELPRPYNDDAAGTCDDPHERFG